MIELSFLLFNADCHSLKVTSSLKEASHDIFYLNTIILLLFFLILLKVLRRRQFELVCQLR